MTESEWLACTYPTLMLEFLRSKASRILARRKQSRWLGDIFGNPFRPAVPDPALLTPTIVALAFAVYDNRILPAGMLDTTRLGILADALEDAGCTTPTS